MSRFKPCIPTMSLGHGSAGHSMETKLEAAARVGFTGIELFYACLESFSLTLEGETPREKLRTAARETRRLADELGVKYGGSPLSIMVFQPILNYDGIIDPEEHAARVEEVVFRMELCKLLGTDMLQVPANFRLDAGVTGDVDKVVSDLVELADLGLKQSPPIRFTYEAIAWSTTNNTWQLSWDIVQRVNRPNFGLVLDGFHIAGLEYADPTVSGGVRPDGRARLAASLAELVETIPGDRVFYVQITDAERLEKPLVEGGGSPYWVEGQQPRMSWSRNCRLFPYEEERGAYLPVEDVMRAFVATGFEGWVSLEVFNRSISTSDPTVPTDHAERAWKSWKTLENRLGL